MDILMNVMMPIGALMAAAFSISAIEIFKDKIIKYLKQKKERK